MVARLLRCSVSLAQKPKSAVTLSVWLSLADAGRLTNFDVAAAVKENVVTLDIAVDNVLVVQVLKTLASLEDVSNVHIQNAILNSPQDRWWQSGPR